MSKSAMTRHLATCPQHQEVIVKAKPDKALETLYYLRVQDAYSKDFWLDPEVRGTAALGDLDNY